MWVIHYRMNFEGFQLNLHRTSIILHKNFFRYFSQRKKNREREASDRCVEIAHFRVINDLNDSKCKLRFNSLVTSSCNLGGV